MHEQLRIQPFYMVPDGKPLRCPLGHILRRYAGEPKPSQWRPGKYRVAGPVGYYECSHRFAKGDRQFCGWLMLCVTTPESRVLIPLSAKQDAEIRATSKGFALSAEELLARLFSEPDAAVSALLEAIKEHPTLARRRCSPTASGPVMARPIGEAGSPTAIEEDSPA